MQEFFGIDFGTTNSAVVGRLLRGVTRYDDGYDQPFPSLVAVNRETGEVQAVGRDAWNRRQELAESCRIFRSAKTYLGEGMCELVGPESWTPERVATEVLRGLKDSVAARGQSSSLDNPVIAIPIGFSPLKRKALRKAAADAGINIRGFVSEPTAAVFRSFESVRQWPFVAVFDWGGGTLDISVVSIQGRVVREIASVPKALGGDDLDRVLAEWAHTQMLRQGGRATLPFSAMSPRHQDALISRCETVKRMLADRNEASISIQRYGDYGTVNLPITSDQFARLMQPKIDDAVATLEEGVIHRAHLSFDQVHILLVGGSSKLRGVQDAMARRGWNFSLPDQSEWHAADGAAMLASAFGNYISSQTIGLRLCDETIYPLIQAGAPVDSAAHVATFGLLEDADNARLVFVEGGDDTEGRVASSDRILGHLVVPAFGFTNEPIQVQSRIDEDLLLHVKARSQARAQSHTREWLYPELRFSYALPETL